MSPDIVNIHTNYPLQNDGIENIISLPNDSSQLVIDVDAINTKIVRFFSVSQESYLNRELIKEVVTYSTNHFSCELNYSATDGFVRKIIVEAISPNGSMVRKRFIVNKTINVD